MLDMEEEWIETAERIRGMYAGAEGLDASCGEIDS